MQLESASNYGCHKFRICAWKLSMNYNISDRKKRFGQPYLVEPEQVPYLPERCVQRLETSQQFTFLFFFLPFNVLRLAKDTPIL